MGSSIYHTAVANLLIATLVAAFSACQEPYDRLYFFDLGGEKNDTYECALDSGHFRFRLEGWTGFLKPSDFRLKLVYVFQFVDSADFGWDPSYLQVLLNGQEMTSQWADTVPLYVNSGKAEVSAQFRLVVDSSVFWSGSGRHPSRPDIRIVMDSCVRWKNQPIRMDTICASARLVPLGAI